MRSECFFISLLVSYLFCCCRLGKLLGDIVISQGGVGEYHEGLFYLISNLFMQCLTLFIFYLFYVFTMRRWLLPSIGGFFLIIDFAKYMDGLKFDIFFLLSGLLE